MEQRFEAACAAYDIPNAVLLASNRDGKFTYTAKFGTMSLKEGAQPVQLDTPMWIASCTKLVTTISALQCVEKGQLTLDDDVSDLVPEIKDLPIITGWKDDGSPSLTSPKNKITLRLLLTHSAGMAYDLFNTEIMKWRKHRGEQIGAGTTVKSRYLHPLLYDPGTGWEYSPSIDFVGLCVERATHTKLQDHMTEFIFKPLGIKDMTFFPHSRPDMQKRMPSMAWRDPKTGKATNNAPKGELVRSPATEALGGGGITASPIEYMKILQALLRNDGTLLAPETLRTMFQPQLTPGSKKALNDALASSPEVNRMMMNYPAEAGKDWGLGGILLETDINGWRSKGTLSWGGMPNLTWFIDPTVGLCGLYASQILPPGETTSVEMTALWEREIYRRYETWKREEHARL